MSVLDCRRQNSKRNIPFAIQSLPGLLDPAPVIVLKVFAGAFEEYPGPGKLPRVVAEELSSQLILLVFNFHGLEKTAGLLRLEALLLDFKDDLRFRGPFDGLQALPNELMLKWSGASTCFSRRDLADHVDPLGQLAGLAAGELAERRLSHPQCSEVVLAHGRQKQPMAA